jgi:hypothetical protein
MTLLNLGNESNLPLHRILKTGTKYHCKVDDEINFIGTIVENAPRVMYVLNEVLGMPPFMLACFNDVWSLDVMYRLIRTTPGEINVVH